MRGTPFLTSRGYTLPDSKDKITDEAFDHLFWLLDTLLSRMEPEWGEYKGKKRKPCFEQPVLLLGQPIGQYHCPGCGMMLIGGVQHFPPTFQGEHYEDEYGQEWPPGYEDEE